MKNFYWSTYILNIVNNKIILNSAIFKLKFNRL